MNETYGLRLVIAMFFSAILYNIYYVSKFSNSDRLRMEGITINAKKTIALFTGKAMGNKSPYFWWLLYYKYEYQGKSYKGSSYWRGPIPSREENFDILILPDSPKTSYAKAFVERASEFATLAYGYIIVLTILIIFLTIIFLNRI